MASVTRSVGAATATATAWSRDTSALDHLSAYNTPVGTPCHGVATRRGRRQTCTAAATFSRRGAMTPMLQKANRLPSCADDDVSRRERAKWYCRRRTTHIVRADGTDSPEASAETSPSPSTLATDVSAPPPSTEWAVLGASGLVIPMENIEVVGSLQEAELEARRAIESLESSSRQGSEQLRAIVGRLGTERLKVPVVLTDQTVEIERDSGGLTLEVEPASNGALTLDAVLRIKDRSGAAGLKERETEQETAAFGEGEESLWQRMKKIAAFAGPALGIWLSSPIMGIIDTAVVGNSSSLELAALGPGTVLCDQLAYVYMFLSIATSNLIATSLAKKDKAAAAGYLARLLCVGLMCGVVMIGLTEMFVTPVLSAFVGGGNQALIPAARSYVRIRSLAWPAILITNIAQSASLGMQDSWGPLKVLLIASLVNAGGDLVLCNGFAQGIAGAAWATMASQWVGMFLMLKLLRDLGTIPVSIKMPSVKDLVFFIKLGGPVLLTMLSKVSYFTFLTYLATSLGTLELAAHQVVIGVFALVSVWGEPLCQTAQSFMPPLLVKNKRKEARTLVKSLLAIGATVGMVMGSLATSLLWVCPSFFTRDPAVVARMQSVSVPLFLCVLLTPSILSLEGTLLATQEFGYFSKSMAFGVIGHALFLMAMLRVRPGLTTNWCCLVLFQMTRFILAGLRVRFANVVFVDSLPLRDQEDGSASQERQSLKTA